MSFTLCKEYVWGSFESYIKMGYLVQSLLEICVSNFEQPHLSQTKTSQQSYAVNTLEYFAAKNRYQWAWNTMCKGFVLFTCCYRRRRHEVAFCYFANITCPGVGVSNMFHGSKFLWQGIWSTRLHLFFWQALLLRKLVFSIRFMAWNVFGHMGGIWKHLEGFWNTSATSISPKRSMRGVSEAHMSLSEHLKGRARWRDIWETSLVEETSGRHLKGSALEKTLGEVGITCEITFNKETYRQHWDSHIQQEQILAVLHCGYMASCCTSFYEGHFLISSSRSAGMLTPVMTRIELIAYEINSLNKVWLFAMPLHDAWRCRDLVHHRHLSAAGVVRCGRPPAEGLAAAGVDGQRTLFVQSGYVTCPISRYSQSCSSLLYPTSVNHTRPLRELG